MRSIIHFFRGAASLITALAAVFLVSCEEYIEPPFDLEASRLIISSNFSPDDKVTVRLTASQPIVGNGNIQEVPDASINIYEGDELLETLDYIPGESSGEGVYRSHDFVPVVGIPYTLQASAPGFTPVTASSEIPTSVDITRLVVSDLVSAVSEQGIRTYQFQLLVDYNDPDFAENFYDLRIKQLVYPYHIMALSGDTIVRDPVFKSVEAVLNQTEANTMVGESSYLVSDKPGGGILIDLVSKVNPKTELLGDLVVELRTVSRDYYQFQVGIQDERRIYNTFSERAVSQNFSNVGGGYGVFAGYSRVTRILSFAD